MERIPEGKTVSLLVTLAEEFNAHFVCGIGEIDENELRYNSAIFISPDGYEGTYRQHREKAGIWIPWTNGYGDKDQKKIFKIKKDKIDVGVAICAEITVTEIANSIVPGVSLMAVPANWYEDRDGSFRKNLEKFDKKYSKPMIIGNRGKEFFENEPKKTNLALQKKQKAILQ